VKKLYRFAIGLLVMGTVLLPGCDEGGKDGKDILPLILLYNSQYYIEFDADYDNNSVVDEHVKMGVKSHFNLEEYNDWYRGVFSGNDNEFNVLLPEGTFGLTTYNETSDFFRFRYTYLETDYASYDDHNFTCEIKQWAGKGTEVYAEFSGELTNNILSDEKIIQITNGKLFARILD
jgi:hypothetical protein